MLKLASLFTDHAVLQRNKSIPVWGWTEGNSKLSLELNGVKIFCNSSLFGNFIARFPSMQAGGPFVLTVRNDTTGEVVTVKDILVGEVWICSGQSNMQYPLNANWGEPNTLTRKARAAGEKPLVEKQAEAFTAEVAEVAEQFRFFHVPLGATKTEELTTDAVWQKMTDEGRLDCTAVGAWFGLKLLRELKVPVGLLFSAYGGTVVEAWTSRSALAMNPYTANLAEEADASLLDEQYTELSGLPAAVSSFEMQKPCYDPGNKGLGQGWASPDYDAKDWLTMDVPGSWIAQKIAGSGAVWVRFELDLDASWCNLDRELILSIGSIDKTDVTYFNGVEIGHMGKGNDDSVYDIPRIYFIPNDLVREGKNVIAVRMWSYIYDGSIKGSPHQFYLMNPETKEKRILSGRRKVKVECDLGNGMSSESNPDLIWRRGNPNTPGILFDTMIRPLVPYGVRGVIWYQGESNANMHEECVGYASKLENMLDDWRRSFCNPELPLIQVELAGFRTKINFSDDEAWPILRDEQQKACREMKGIYMATAVDTGEVDDIHPQEKRIPAERLACCALNKVYGRADVTPHGPVLQRFELQGDTARLYFSEADGMEFRGDPTQSFFVAATSRHYTRKHDFKPADEVRIEGNCIIVKSNIMPWIGSVRYAWSDFPELVLYNKAGLPASPFRTDDWNLIISATSR